MRAIAAILLLLFSALPAFAEPDLKALCESKVESQIQSLLKDLRRLENHYAGYRWAEEKIRDLYYNRLWKARRDSMDPFSKDIRKLGQAEEKRLLEVLSGFEKESLEHSNGFAETLRKIENSISDWRHCCPEKSFFDCASASFQSISKTAGEMRAEYEHVFEHEREFRKEISLTAGGREGLYPEEAVEVPALHEEYYWRFEAGREARRFAEDQKIRDFIHDIEKTLTLNFEGKKCCLECGK